ncbi:MAG: hypothetical protein COT18_00505 [Elusimicrobia bacterium CG08_land_8_20_14_0_20_59_10]|nr:MAG: hypothetical protein COT18_00505 [Elusimicrobia bacterium CG08_land_8_20_14_0_20_59_10]
MKLLLLLALLLSPAAARAQALAELQRAYNSAAAKAGPAVVSVKVVKEETETVVEPDYYFGYMVPSEKLYRYHSAGLGSGVIVDKRGYVLTNLHVVEDAVKIRLVTQNAKGVEKEWMASAVAADPALDLALLKIDDDGPFPWLDLSAGAGARVGDLVLAVGYPFGFKQTFTSGIISALNASLPVEGRKYEKLIQTDAAINHGNSGGPLLNLKGEIVGINTAIASPTGVFAGMGFAVPASEIKRVLPDLLAGRPIKRGWLGVSLLHLEPYMAARLGLPSTDSAIVNVVAPGSPADRAGIRRGDLLLTCDGDPIETNEDLFLKTFSRRPGDEIELVLRRKAKKMTVRLKLGERGVDDRKAASAGPRARAAREQGELQWEGVGFVYDDGALVTGLSQKSRLAGYLRRGDRIRAVNGRAVDSPRDLKKAFAGASLAEGVVFDLLRDGEATYLSVQSR